jgi:hypothetical protein
MVAPDACEVCQPHNQEIVELQGGDRPQYHIQCLCYDIPTSEDAAKAREEAIGEGDLLSEKSLAGFREQVANMPRVEREQAIQDYFTRAVQDAVDKGMPVRLPEFNPLESKYVRDFEVQGKLSPSNKDAVEEFKNWFSTHVSPDVTNRAGFVDGYLERNLSSGCCGQYSAGPRMIEWDGKSGAKTLVHEYGHHIENFARIEGKTMGASPRMIETQFFRRRTEGETVKVLFGDIQGIKDKFFNAYVGRCYKGQPGEIISTGLEAMFKNPAVLLAKDPEHFNLILSIMYGIF